MDNNFNQQPVYGQPAYQQPVKKSSINVLELIALICSGVGALMSVIGSILTCSCSASKTYDISSMLSMLTSGSLHKMSLVWLLAILGAIVSVAGVVLAILALKSKTAKAGKLACVAIAVGAFGFVYGILPVLTICGYNCSLNSAYKSQLTNSLGGMFK